MKEWICEEVPAVLVNGEALTTFMHQTKELVRCKDCKHGSLYCTEDVCGATLIECNHPDLGETVSIHKWNWFCADGERKEGR